MATVHLGRLNGPVGFSRTVAIKRMLPAYVQDQEFVQMFLDEAKLAARIRHPNVVPTLDVVSENDELFLVMEYIQGETVSRLLNKTTRAGGRIPLPIAAAIVSGALHGLHAAHEARDELGDPLGIVHRDVSPQNIIVGIDGVARMLDFGVAKAANSVHTTRAGLVKGKIPYMAPELLRGAKATRRSDIFSAAVVLWEVIVGEHLFDSEHDAAAMMRLLEDEILPPSLRVPEVPPTLDAITLRGLSREPERRFPSARAMAAAIEAAVPIASPAAVGAWVEELAVESIARRTAAISAIERAPASARAPAERPSQSSAPPAPAQQTPMAEAGPSQISSISVTTPVTSSLPQRRLALGAGIAVPLVLVAGLALSRLVSAPESSHHEQYVPAVSAVPEAAPPPSSAPAETPLPPAAVSSSPPAASSAPARRKPPVSGPAPKGGVLFRNPG